MNDYRYCYWFLFVRNQDGMEHNNIKEEGRDERKKRWRKVKRGEERRKDGMKWERNGEERRAGEAG